MSTNSTTPNSNVSVHLLGRRGKHKVRVQERGVKNLLKSAEVSYARYLAGSFRNPYRSQFIQVPLFQRFKCRIYLRIIKLYQREKLILCSVFRRVEVMGSLMCIPTTIVIKYNAKGRGRGVRNRVHVVHNIFVALKVFQSEQLLKA